MKSNKTSPKSLSFVWTYTVAYPMCPEVLYTGRVFSTVSLAQDYASDDLPGVVCKPAFDTNVYTGVYGEGESAKLAFLRKQSVQGTAQVGAGDRVFIVLKRSAYAMALLIPNTDCVFATFKMACRFVRSMYPNARIDEESTGCWVCTCRAGQKEESFYIYEEIVK